jgi:competence protein ComEC
MAFSPCLATLPLTIYYFGQFSCVGILTNILLLPWISCIVVLGFIAYLVGVVFLPLADVINGANLILLAISDKIVSFLAELPFAQIFIAAPKIPIVIGYYLCLAGGVEVIRRGRIPRFTRFRSFLLVLLLLTCLAWNSALSDISSLVITVLNVGQGEAIYIESPAGKKILLDGGTAERASKVVLPFLARKGVNQLDFVLFSHLHDDHAAGLYTVLRRIPCRKILDQTKVRAREEIDFGGGAKGVVLYAHSNLIPRAAEENANRSLAFKLIYHNFSMLFTGDNAAEDEAAMLQALPVSQFSSAVLKVGHHGSRLSTTDNFLDKVHPRVAVISCGRHNRFYHPHATTLNKLVTRGIKVYRTDRQGTITIRTNGEQFAVACEKLE